MLKDLSRDLFTMDELSDRLNSVKDAYYDFISAVIHYAEKKPERLEAVLSFIRENPKALSSDIVEFISRQDDFFEDAAIFKTNERY
jgi:hypothetical protein